MAGAESYAKDRPNNLEIQTSPRKIVKFYPANSPEILGHPMAALEILGNPRTSDNVFKNSHDFPRRRMGS